MYDIFFYTCPFYANDSYLFVKLDLFDKKSKENTVTAKEQTIEKQSPSKQKKKSSNNFAYCYSIIPTNFINLSEESQVQRLGQFFDILNVIDDKINNSNCI